MNETQFMAENSFPSFFLFHVAPFSSYTAATLLCFTCKTVWPNKWHRTKP